MYYRPKLTYRLRWQRIAILSLGVWIISFIIAYNFINFLEDDYLDSEIPIEGVPMSRPQINTVPQNPSFLYEHIRRRLINTMEELDFYTNDQLKRFWNTQENPIFQDFDINSYEKMNSEFHAALSMDINKLIMVDRHNEWRNRKINYLTELVQLRLNNLQFPKTCKKVKKIVCTLRINEDCDILCNLHYIVSCLAVAYATQRTLVLSIKEWDDGYLKWDNIFQPIGSCEVNHELESEDIDLIFLDDVTFPDLTKYYPPSLPSDIADKLVNIHGDPVAWWLGQLTSYCFKLKPNIKTEMENLEKKIKFSSLVFGIYIPPWVNDSRPKNLQDTYKCFNEAKKYFDSIILSKTIDAKRVFTTNGNPTLNNIKKKWPDLQIRVLSNGERLPDSLIRIFELDLLSKSDFLICNFTLEGCRLAYQLLQTYHVDGSTRFEGFDDPYHHNDSELFDSLKVQMLQTSLPNRATSFHDWEFVLNKKQSKSYAREYEIITYAAP